MSTELTTYAHDISELYQKALQQAAGAVETAIQVGEKLNEAKLLTKFGQWELFVRETGMGLRKAQSYMQLANNKDKLKSAESAHLSIGSALKYLAVAKEVDPFDTLIAPDVRSILKFYPEILGIHPECGAYGVLPPAEFRAFARSIDENGLRMPIILTPDGLLLDGAIRLTACHVTRAEVRFKVTKIEPISYTYSANVLRQHLDWREREDAIKKIREAT